MYSDIYTTKYSEGHKTFV